MQLIPRIWSYFLGGREPIYKIKHENFTYKFHTPNRLTYWRAKTFLSKEPETLEWIDSFEENAVFYDIGANIGLYSIYAAARKKNIKIYSFEPAFFNYHLLNKNIHANGLGDKVTALCLALGDKNCQDVLNIPRMIDGAAYTSFGKSVDHNRKEIPTVFKQGSLGFKLDRLIPEFSIPYPNYVKIDVDGLELEVVKGMETILGTGGLKSVSIELNSELASTKKIEIIMDKSGLKYQGRKHGMLYDNHSKFSDVFNYQFVRKN